MSTRIKVGDKEVDITDVGGEKVTVSGYGDQKFDKRIVAEMGKKKSSIKKPPPSGGKKTKTYEQAWQDLGAGGQKKYGGDYSKFHSAAVDWNVKTGKLTKGAGEKLKSDVSIGKPIGTKSIAVIPTKVSERKIEGPVSPKAATSTISGKPTGTRKERKVARLEKKLEKVEGKAAGAGAGAYGSRIGQLKTRLSTATSRLDASREKMGGTVSKATDPNYNLMSGFMRSSKSEEGKMTVKKGDIKTSTVKGDLGGELSGFVESDFAQPLTGEAAEKFILGTLKETKPKSEYTSVKPIHGGSGNNNKKYTSVKPIHGKKKT